FLQRGDGCIGDLASLHPRPLFERHLVAGDLEVAFQLVVELAAAIAVPKIGDVTVLLRFAASESALFAMDQVFAHGLSYRGRAHQKVLRQLEIAVVLHHTAIEDLGAGSAIESLEMFILEGSADLDGSVTAEVEEHDG